MIKTDILIIGAGPTGLFTVFEAGLLKLKCHLIDALPQPGGQCSEIYPKKPIYDIPAYPEILAGDLTEKLLEQIKSFQPGFTLGERAETIEKLADDTFIVTTNKGTKHHAPVVAIAGGLGSFEPRKPPIPDITNFEDTGVEYIIRDPEMYRNKKVVIAGGGDSALDWAIFLTDVAAEVSLVHRRNEFRGALDSVDKVQELKDAGKINMITPAEVTEILGDKKVTGVSIIKNGLYDYHPESIPAPYNHSNIDSDEVIYYVDGDFMSRNDIEAGHISLHPAGIPHGPHPGATEKSIGKTKTEELAVMVDTFKPLKVTQEAMEIADEEYHKSWLE